MRCTATTKIGIRCRWPATTIVGGTTVCQYHVRQAERLFDAVRDRLPEDVRAAAIADSCREVRCV